MQHKIASAQKVCLLDQYLNIKISQGNEMYSDATEACWDISSSLFANLLLDLLVTVFWQGSLPQIDRASAFECHKNFARGGGGRRVLPCKNIRLI